MIKKKEKLCLQIDILRQDVSMETTLWIQLQTKLPTDSWTALRRTSCRGVIFFSFLFKVMHLFWKENPWTAATLKPLKWSEQQLSFGYNLMFCWEILGPLIILWHIQPAQTIAHVHGPCPCPHRSQLSVEISVQVKNEANGIIYIMFLTN